MVIGIDVYHDAGTGRSGTDRQSVVGMVASLNRGFTRYFNDTCFQGRGEEVVTGLRVFIVGVYAVVEITLSVLFLANPAIV